MKEAVAGELSAAYDSAIVEQVRAHDFQFQSGRLTIHLAREFGFCYGVDRAVDYAYQARRRFPGRNVFLTGEIIHNPHVNDRLRDAGIRFLSDTGRTARHARPGRRRHPAGLRRHRRRDGAAVAPGLHAGRHDVRLRAQRVEERRPLRAGRLHRGHPRQGQARRDARDRVAGPEVPRGAVSRRARSPRGDVVCDYIRRGGDRAAFLARFEGRMSPGFDPDRDLERIGCANQTTMLMSESLEIGEMFRVAMRERYGEAAAGGPFPRVRHHLQRDAGAAGRGARPAGARAARPDARRRRLQQQQHLQPRAHLRRARADVPHRGSRGLVRATRSGIGRWARRRRRWGRRT